MLLADWSAENVNEDTETGPGRWIIISICNRWVRIETKRNEQIPLSLLELLLLLKSHRKQPPTTSYLSYNMPPTREASDQDRLHFSLFLSLPSLLHVATDQQRRHSMSPSDIDKLAVGLGHYSETPGCPRRSVVDTSPLRPDSICWAESLTRATLARRSQQPKSQGGLPETRIL
jgi:hypothetical protein